MDIHLIPQVPSLRFKINDLPMGMVSAVQETMTTTPLVIRSMGASSPTAVLPGAVQYTIRMTRLLLDTTAIPVPVQFRGLHGFTLKIISDSKIITFSGCEVTKLVFSSDMEQGMVEEAEIMAFTRSEASRTQGGT